MTNPIDHVIIIVKENHTFDNRGGAANLNTAISGNSATTTRA